MKEVIKLLSRFIPMYRLRLSLNILFNILQAIFNSFSFLMMIPVLGILFGTVSDVNTLQPWDLSIEHLKNNFEYYITHIKFVYGASSSLLFVGGFILLATFFKTAFSYLASYEMTYIRNSIVADIRNKIFAKVLKLPLPFFSDERKGDIMTRMTSDVSEVENSIMSSLDVTIKNPIIIIVSLATMLYLSWPLTLFAFLMLPVVGILLGRVGKSLKKPSMEGQKKLGVLLSIIDETLQGLRIIKAFNADEKMENMFNTDSHKYRRTMNFLMRKRDLASPLSEFLGTGVIIGVLWFGGKLILSGNGSLTAEAFFPYLGVFYSIINPAKAFSTAFFSIQKGMASMDRIDVILNADSSIKEKENAIELTDFKDEIEYRNVCFSYILDRPVLSNINLKVPKGHTVALVGQSGSGKTTLVDLLPRFYDIDSGLITIDGVDIKDCTLSCLHELIGNVNQDPILFNDTVFNNIAFGVKDATMEDVIAASTVANAHEFIVQMEQGYDSNIGDRGGKLSGGQRQRLSIARAILKNPPILILDEATSALDNQSERLVQDALDNLMKHRTTIVIAHRLSTIRNANMICVFRDGIIVEQGTHDELLARNGEYTKLHEMQQ